MDDKIKQHFKKNDTVLYKALEKIGALEVVRTRVPKEYFPALCREILAQQLSGRVAEVIFQRFRKLFPKGKITAAGVLKLQDGDLRATGMSNAKVKFLKDLAQKVKSGQLQLNKLAELGDEDVTRKLTQVKGIGQWTAEMFLMFCLGREDVFSHGDQGLRNAVKKLYNLENPNREEVEAIVAKWSPYKTYGARILWKISNS